VSDLRNLVEKWLTEESITVDKTFIENGICSLVSRSNTELTIEVPLSGSVIYFFSALMTVNSSNRELLFAKALTINTQQNLTQGACIGFHGELNSLSLCYALPVKQSNLKNSLINCLSSFIKKTESIKASLENAISNTNRTTAKGESNLPMHPSLRRHITTIRVDA
jgi:Tir chaperone protein (CesT) family